MSIMRRFPRISYNVDGLLQHEDTSFNCRLENISLSGALVSLKTSKFDRIHLGDTFLLKIGNEAGGASIAILVRVAYIGFSLLGLAFLDLDAGVKSSLELIIAKATPAPVLKTGVPVHLPG